MRILIFATLLISTAVNSADILSECKEIKIETKKFPHRIPDDQLNIRQKQAQFRGCKTKEGECLYKSGSSQCREIFAIYNTEYAIFNASGYTVDAWYKEFPNTPSGPIEYCRNSVGLNPPEINNPLQVFSHYEYWNCTNKDGEYKGSFSGNTEGCYWFEYKDVEIVTYEPCMIYRCLETDIIPGQNRYHYTCQVFCEYYNRPSQWSYHYNSYTCEHLPIDDPEPEYPQCYGDEAEAWNCLGDDVANALADLNINVTNTFYDLNDKALNQLNEIESNQDKNIDEQNNNNDDEQENTENYEFENVDIPVLNNEVTQFLQNIFPTNAQCPADNTVNIMGGEYKFSYGELCSYLALLGNLVMIFSIYFSYRLIRSI